MEKIIKGVRTEITNIGKKNLLYQIFNNPNIYFIKLFVSTLSIGLFTLLFSFVYTHTGLHGIRIPTTMHSLIGIVIGLLLVFRTNTAYDRWWEGRKNISLTSTAISFFVIKYNSCLDSFDEISTKLIKDNLQGFLDNLKKYLSNTTELQTLHVSNNFHKDQMKYMQNVMIELHKLKNKNIIPSRDVSMFENTINSLLEYSNSFERIKNTPIPMSYTLHIRVSIFIYLMTLPFGLFYDLGLWATPVIMLIYYLIAGIEIISNEIENPFGKDPNDLPVAEMIDSIIDSLEMK